MKTSAEKKAAHRPKGSPDKKSAFVRDHDFGHFRCSQGFVKTVDELMATGRYKSKSDIMHEALQILAHRQLPANFYWINKIQ